MSFKSKVIEGPVNNPVQVQEPLKTEMLKSLNPIWSLKEIPTQFGNAIHNSQTDSYYSNELALIEILNRQEEILALLHKATSD
jgi:hypothetical protein